MREGRRVTTILATLLFVAACGGGSTTSAKPSPTPSPTPVQSRGVFGTDTITTIAGTGKAGISGDGGPATTAQLSYPEAVAVDVRGNVYIGDSYNHRVRMVSGGTITTIAGTGKADFSGDGGPASAASLSHPAGAAVDGQGNVYIASGARVRKVSGGTITTIAGTGIAGFSGDGGAAAMAQLGGAIPGYAWGLAVDMQGNLYIADYSNSRVRKVVASA